MVGLAKGYEEHRNQDMTYVVRVGEHQIIREMGLTDLFTVEDMVASGRRQGRGRVFEVFPDEEYPGQALVLKQVLHGGLYGRINRQRYLGPQRLLRELQVTVEARERGVPVPEIAFLAWTSSPCRLFLATVRVPGSRNLEEAACHEPRSRHREQALTAVARAVREMHDAGLVHGDLNIWNVMVTEYEGFPEAYILDLDRSRFPPKVTETQRAANLARLLRSLKKTGRAARRVTPRDRARFLREYCGGMGPQYRRLRKLIGRRTALFGLHELAWRLGWR